MPYDRDTPLTINETFSVSQPKIKNNFIAIDEFVSVDHEPLGDPSDDQGKHKQVRFLERANDIPTNVDEMALYTMDTGNQPNLYLRLEGDGTTFNITPSTAGHGGDSNTNGWEILPSGLKIVWGSVAVSAETGGTWVPFPSAFTSHCFQVVISRVNENQIPGVAHVVALDTTENGFRGSSHDMNGAAINSAISYIAIGI